MLLVTLKRRREAGKDITRLLKVLLGTTIALMMLTSACASSPPVESAEQRFRDFEALMTRSGRFDFRAHVTSSGAVASDVTANVGVANAGIVVIRMSGSFAGKTTQSTLRSDGIVTMLASGDKEARLQPGKSMRQAVQIGFARVGLWHNLMLLSHGNQPEHHRGGIADWADVTNVHYAKSSGDSSLIGLAFDVVIEGEHAGQATLWLDAQSHLPRRRHQSITIDGRTITIDEEYTDFTPTA